MAHNFWKCLEKRNDGRSKFQRSSHLINIAKQAITKNSSEGALTSSAYILQGNKIDGRVVWYLSNKIVHSNPYVLVETLLGETESDLIVKICCERSLADMPVHFDVCDRANEDFEKTPKYQNSYRLDTNHPFKIDPVDKIVRSVMVNRLEDASYDPNECRKLCSQVASEIRKRILKLDYERYKIVVVVTIIEKASQSLETSMGFMWDADRDNHSTYTFETQTFFAYCAVVGTYYE